MDETVLVLYQIPWIHWIPIPFRENSIVWSAVRFNFSIVKNLLIWTSCKQDLPEKLLSYIASPSYRFCPRLGSCILPPGMWQVPAGMPILWCLLHVTCNGFVSVLHCRVAWMVIEKYKIKFSAFIFVLSLLSTIY